MLLFFILSLLQSSFNFYFIHIRFSSHFYFYYHLSIVASVRFVLLFDCCFFFFTATHQLFYSFLPSLNVALIFCNFLLFQCTDNVLISIWMSDRYSIKFPESDVSFQFFLFRCFIFICFLLFVFFIYSVLLHVFDIDFDHSNYRRFWKKIKITKIYIQDTCKHTYPRAHI